MVVQIKLIVVVVVVTSPIWGPPPQCKQALRGCLNGGKKILEDGFTCRKFGPCGTLIQKELRMANDINKYQCNLGAPFHLLSLSTDVNNLL